MQYAFTFYLLFSVGGSNDKFIRNYLGCYETFNGLIKHVDTISLNSCIEACKADIQVYTFASLKNGAECYCGNNFGSSTHESNCQRKFEDSPNEYCGGKYYSVFSICSVGSYGITCNDMCNKCQNSVPCLRNDGDCFLSKCRKMEAQCDLARFLNDVNVAFNRPAWQSSTYPNHPASLAVDGKTDSNFNVGTCSQTEKHMNSWLCVDFEIERNIKKIIITSRRDEQADELRQAEVSLSNEPPNEGLEVHSCGQVSIQNYITFNCMESSNKYRYVTVRLPKKESLTICEIEAYINECDCEKNEVCSNMHIHGKYHSRCTCKDGFFKKDIYSQCTG